MGSVVPGVRELARQSTFVGFVHCIRTGGGDTTSFLTVSSPELIGGRLPDRWKTEPVLYAASANRLGYTNRLPERATALVFARPGDMVGRPGWVALAVFPVRYTPGPGKRMRGALGGGLYGSRTLALGEVRRLLPAAVRGDRDAAGRLDPVLAGISQAIDALSYPLKHEPLLADTRALAKSVERGTTRAEVETLFPQEDGGLSALTSSRYYRAAEVMVKVPYEVGGGGGRGMDRVKGPLRVYRDGFHTR